MKTRVVKLYDMQKVTVPEELCKWRVSKEELDAQLARLAAAHPVESKPNTVELGDSVLCCTKGDDSKWNRDAVPFYPGRGMLPSSLENGLLGMKHGETKTVEGIEITVLEITRRRPAILTDEVIAKENIDGVRTLDQYCDWWKERTEQDRKRAALSRVIYAVQNEMVQNSVFECDEEELSSIAHSMAQKQYNAMVKAGIDPTIPDDGVDFLTEEEALEKIAAENRQRLLGCVLNAYYATVLYPMTQAAFDAAMAEFEKSMKKTKAELIEYAGEFLVNDYIYGKVFAEKVAAYAETLLEDSYDCNRSI